MITVGLIKELNFISVFLKKPVNVTFHIKYSLNVKIKNNILIVNYNEIDIWKENISDDGFFGIESCDAISRIIYLIDKGANYLDYIYIEE